MVAGQKKDKRNEHLTDDKAADVSQNFHVSGCDQIAGMAWIGHRRLSGQGELYNLSAKQRDRIDFVRASPHGNAKRDSRSYSSSIQRVFCKRTLFIPHGPSLPQEIFIRTYNHIGHTCCNAKRKVWQVQPTEHYSGDW